MPHEGFYLKTRGIFKIKMREEIVVFYMSCIILLKGLKIVFNDYLNNYKKVKSFWLPTKDETSETIVRNLFNPFSCIQGWVTCRSKQADFCA